MTPCAEQDCLNDLTFGLNELRSKSVDVAITYGDPSFFSKVGFRNLSEDVFQASLKLLIPEGWLGQSLSGQQIPKINERSDYVRQFNDAA